MGHTVKKVEFQRALGGMFREEAMAESRAEGNNGILNPPAKVTDPVLDQAIYKVRHAQEEDEVPVNDVVNVEMARAMKVIGQVNEKKGKRGYTTIAKGEVKAASDLDPELAPKLVKAYEILSGKTPLVGAAAIAKSFETAAKGLTFMSESDYPYEAFSCKLDRAAKIDTDTLKQLMVWDADPNNPNAGPTEYPNKFSLQASADDGFWKNFYDGISATEKAQWGKVEKKMLDACVPSEVTDEKGVVQKATLFTVTATDAAVCAPYYVFGRTKDGDVVGLKSWRVWT